MEDTANYWLEMVVEDSYNEDMSAGEFGQTSRLLIDLLSNMILADEAIAAAKAIEEAREINAAKAAIRNDDMAAWLGVNRKTLQGR